MASYCCGGIVRLLSPPADYSELREDFEQTVRFLESVPLFRKQLPRAELPKVAQRLTSKTWQPGDCLVRQGVTGTALFIIQSGEAQVVTRGVDGIDEVRCVLTSGDYFGGHTLLTERPNVATILAGGKKKLVTLSLSKIRFDELGIKKWLSFPKRPALYGDRTGTPQSEKMEGEALTEEEQAFVRKAINNNINLRAMLQAGEGKLHEIAAAAVRLKVPKGKVVADQGEVVRQFIVVREGMLDVVVADCSKTSGENRSAEQAVASSTMTERFLRRQHFLQEMSNAKKTHLSKTASMYSGSNGNDVGASGKSKQPRRNQPQKQPTFGNDKSAQDGPLRRCNSGERATRALSTALARGADGSRPMPNCETTAVGVGMSNSGHAAAGSASRTWERQESRTWERQESKSKELAAAPETALRSGDSFGELSVLYNLDHHATVVARDECVLYAVAQRHFAALFNRRGRRFEEYCKLLDEVNLLASLLAAERWELACNARGLVEFKPGERVLNQGHVRKERRFYIIASGSAVVSINVEESPKEPAKATAPRERASVRRPSRVNQFIGTGSGSTEDMKREISYSSEKSISGQEILCALSRAGHFGERSVLRGDAKAPVNIEAGPQGMTCLTFDGESIKPLLLKVYDVSDGPRPDNDCIKEWWCRKARGFSTTKLSPLSPASCWDRLTSNLKVQLEDLTKVCVLGRGGYGQVTLVEDKTRMEHQRYALKVVSKGHINQQGAGRLVSWERELLGMVDSNFVIRLHKTYKDKQHVYFLLEAALGGCLLDVLHESRETLQEDNPRGSSMAFYAACITAAVEHLHERSIVHRDLKPENCLLDERGYAKVCDMGFARFVLSKTNTLAGTPEYMAPEMIDFPHTHGRAVDWWALGVLTFELLAGQTPFEDEGISDPRARLLAIRRSQQQGSASLRYPYNFPYAAKGFVSQLLQISPDSRLGAGAGGAEDVRAHAMFGALKFDFPRFHAQDLPAPYHRKWNEPVVYENEDYEHDVDAGWTQLGLGLSPSDSIFVDTNIVEKQEGFEQSDWDAMF